MATHTSLNQLNARAGAVAVTALALAYFLVTGPLHAFDLGDEGYVLYVAQQLLQGGRLYTDIELFNYLPGTFYIFAPLLKMSEEAVLATRAALAIPLALCAWLIYRVVADEVGSTAGIVAALLLIVAPGASHRFYIAALNLALLLFAAQYLRTGRRGWLVALGATAGIALCVRIDAGVAGLAMLAVCVALVPRASFATTRTAAAFSGVLGLLLGLSPIWGFFAAEGILPDYLRQLAAIPAAVLERSGADYQLSPPGPGELWRRSSFAVIYYASLLVPLSAAAMLCNPEAKLGDRRRFWIITGVWLLFNLPQCLLERPDITHFSHRTYALIVPAVVYFCHATAHPRRAPGVYGRATIALAWALLLIGTPAYAVLAYDSPGSFGRAIQPRENVCLGNGACYVHTSNNATPDDLMDEALKRLTPGEPVAVLPYGPGIAYLLRRPLPGRQVFMLPHSVRRDDAEHEYIRALHTAKVRYVFLDSMFRYSESERTTFPSYAPAITRVLSECYLRVAEQRWWVLLERNDGETRCTQPR